MSSRYLPEVPESEAAGTVAETYEDIRRVIGLPLVNLVYRTLAVEPGRLERIWRELRPNLLHPVAASGAAELASLGAAPASVVSIPPSALAAAGVDQEELTLAAATLDVYSHANPRNLIALLALLQGTAGTMRDPPEVDAPVGAAVETGLLPMADLSSLTPAVRALLEDIGSPITGRAEPIIVPSLPRHFAHNAAFLGLLWTALRPAVRDGCVKRAAEAVAARGSQLAAALPYPVRRLEDEATRAVVQRFSALAIPRMIVVGAGLRRSLEEALAAAVP